MSESKRGLPACEYCGRTIRKYRREWSSWCTDKCAEAQDRDDAASAIAETEEAFKSDDAASKGCSSCALLREEITALREANHELMTQFMCEPPADDWGSP